MTDRFMEGIETTLNSSQIERVSNLTEGWSGSDIESLCREASMAPLRNFMPDLLRFLNSHEHHVGSCEFDTLPAVEFDDFAEAHARMLANSAGLD